MPADDPSLTERVARVEEDLKWLKKIVFKDHYLLIASLVSVILSLLGIIALFLKG